MEKIFRWRPFLAPFHAVVLHFPIGFVTTAFLLEAYRAVRPGDELRRVTAWALWLSLFAAGVSALFGLMRASGGCYETHLLHQHKTFGLCVPVAVALVLGLQRLAYRDEKQRGWTVAYRAALTGAIALVTIAGHLGGTLTHGSKYLVENAPNFLKNLLEEKASSTSAVNPEGVNQKVQFYYNMVQPVLAAKCYGCHGPEKQKGGYRLDDPTMAFKGGKSGRVAIKPGDSIESHLVRLILLPPGHDDAMPPEGKQPLTSDEIMVLITWIRDGAPFPRQPSKMTSSGRL